MIWKWFANRFIFIFGVKCVVANLSGEFQFTYNLLTHDTIELQTVYHGFKIDFIEFKGSNNFKPISKFSNNSDHIIIHRLESCVNYQIRASVTNLQLNSQFFYSENVTTIANGFPIKIQSVESAPNAIYIELNFSRTDCMNNLVLVLDNSLRLFYTRENITKQLIIPELKLCTHYYIEIFLNQQHKIFEQYVKTKPGPLEPAENFKFNRDTNMLTWGAIFLGNCPTKYIITINSQYYQNTLFTGESMINQYDFGFLGKCLQFHVKIHPEGRNDLIRTIHIQTSYQEPGPITNISVNLTPINSLLIKWNYPEKNPQCIKNFVIKLNDVPEASTDALKHILYEIKPWDISNISVCLITQHSTEICFVRPFHFTPLALKNVSEVKVHSNGNVNRTIITWDVPTRAERNIKHYEVTLVDDSRLVRHQNVTYSNRLEIPILPSCTTYLLHIITVPLVKMANTIESSFEFRTEPQLPFPPTTPKLLRKTTNSLTMETFRSTQNGDNCEIEMFRFKCVCDYQTRFLNEESGFGVMTNLKSGTIYDCSVTVKNVVGWSKWSNTIKFSTENSNVEFDSYVHSISYNSIGISWNRKFLHINLTITKVLNNGGTCMSDDFKFVVTSGGNKMKHKFKNLQPYTNYSIKAVAVGLTGKFTNDIIVATFPHVTHQVENLKIINSTSHSVTICWNLPCPLNGRLKGFVIKVPPSETFLTVEDGKEVPNIFYYTANLTTYTNISVAIKLYNLVGSLNESSIAIRLPIWEWIEITMIDPVHAVLLFKNEKFMMINGNVTGFTLVVSNRACHNLETDDVSSLLSLKDSCIQQCHFGFVPSKATITLSEGKSQFCSTPGKLELKRGPDYAILARIFTTSGNIDTFPNIFKTNQVDKILHSSSNFIMVSLILIVSLIFIIMSVSAILWYYKNQMPQKGLTIAHRINASYIEVQFFPDFYKLIDHSFIDNEFKSINDMNLSNLPKTVAKNYPEKNRYMNIIPYDFNRVLLTPNEYCPTDYINASYIDGEKQPGQYIATQGPLEETAYDFWHMVIEQSCDKIVMLTQLTESNVTKCIKYYPNMDETIVLNDITITNAAETSNGTFVRRQLNVERAQTKHLIVQYQFLAWPDFECPVNKLDVIEFIEFVKNEKSQNPMVVHCSAGVGRTGTFIALDILLQSFRHDKFINIFDTVRKLRVQRYGMVQNVDQYQFLYALVNVYFHRRMYK